MENHKSLQAFCDGRVIAGPNADLDMVMHAIKLRLEQACTQYVRCDMSFEVGFPCLPVPDEFNILKQTASDNEDNVHNKKSLMLSSK